MSLLQRAIVAQQLVHLQGGASSGGATPPPPEGTHDSQIEGLATYSDLIAWFKGADFTDSIGTFADGTPNGTVAADGAKMPSHSAGPSLDFAGAGHVSFPHPGSIVERAAGTISVLVQADPGSLSDQRGVFGTARDPSTGDVNLHWFDGGLVFEIYDGATFHQARALGALAEGVPACVQMTWGAPEGTGGTFDDGALFDDGSGWTPSASSAPAEMRLHVNGELVATNPYSGGVPSTVAGPWFLGATGFGLTPGEFWAGLIAHFTYHDRVLTASELADLNPFTSAPIAFDDVAGQLQANTGPVDVDVLANDFYHGTPSVVIVSQTGPGTATVVGSGATSEVRIPTDGGAGAKTVTYELTSTGSTGSAQATVTAEVVASTATYDSVVAGAATFGDLLVWLKGSGDADAQGTFGPATIAGDPNVLGPFNPRSAVVSDGTAATISSYAVDGTYGDRTLVVVVAVEEGNNPTDQQMLPTSVAYGGAALTLRRSLPMDAGSTTRAALSLWELPDPPAGSADLVVTGVAGSQSGVNDLMVLAWHAAQTTGINVAGIVSSEDPAGATPYSISLPNVPARALAFDATMTGLEVPGLTTTQAGQIEVLDNIEFGATTPSARGGASYHAPAEVQRTLTFGWNQGGAAANRLGQIAFWLDPA